MTSEAGFSEVLIPMAERKPHKRDDKTTESTRPNLESRWEYFLSIAQWEDDGGNAWNPLPAVE